MDFIEIDLLRGEIDALVADLDEERHRHVAGVEGEPSISAAFRRRSRAAHRDTVRLLEAAGEADLARRVAALRAERAQAEDEEAWRAAEPAARAPGPAGPIALDEAQLAQLRERDRDRRLAFGRAVAEAADHPAREAAAEKRARARAEMGLLPEWERVVAADALLSASDDGYRDVLTWLARRESGLSPGPGGDLERADLLFALALHGWEGHFPKGMLALALERTAAELGVDLGLVRVDEAARPGQWPGAHAHGARVSFRRQGGAADWLGLFEAVGRALSAASAPAHRRDPAGPATCGSLLAGLILDARYLATTLDVERKHAPDLARALARAERRRRARGAPGGARAGDVRGLAPRPRRARRRRGQAGGRARGGGESRGAPAPARGALRRGLVEESAQPRGGRAVARGRLRLGGRGGAPGAGGRGAAGEDGVKRRGAFSLRLRPESPVNNRVPRSRSGRERREASVQRPSRSQRGGDGRPANGRHTRRWRDPSLHCRAT
jgi:hypothetical protein